MRGRDAAGGQANLRGRIDRYKAVCVRVGAVAGAVAALVPDLGPGWAGGGALARALAGVVAGPKLAGAVFDAIEAVRKLRHDVAAATKPAREVLDPATRDEPPVRQVDPFSVGVLESAAAEEYRLSTRRGPPAVCDAHDRPTLRQAITALGTDGGVVVVRGDPKAGKSRTLWEALAATPATQDRALYAIRQPSAHDVDGADVGRPSPRSLTRTLAWTGRTR